MTLAWGQGHTNVAQHLLHHVTYAPATRLGGKFQPRIYRWNLPVFPGMANKAQVANTGK